MNELIYLGKRLKKLRIKKGMSQKELGEELGVSKVSVCGYENCKRIPTIQTLCLIADSFNVSIDYLFGKDNRIKKSNVEISNEDLEILKSLKENQELYKYILACPERRAKCLNKKIKKMMGEKINE